METTVATPRAPMFRLSMNWLKTRPKEGSGPIVTTWKKEKRITTAIKFFGVLQRGTLETMERSRRRSCDEPHEP